MTEIIESIEGFVEQIRKDYQAWDTRTFPWFRGECESYEGTSEKNNEEPTEKPTRRTTLLPTLYRETHNDNQLLQSFRAKAPQFGDTPANDDTDKWLSLARHAGIPTRLLDWSEGALIALYFALNKKSPVVWMLHPIRLNNATMSLFGDERYGDNQFPLPWFKPDSGINIAHENIAAAWAEGEACLSLPVATYPRSVHSRMAGQRSCFTVHGNKGECLDALVDEYEIKGCLEKYVIVPENQENQQQLIQELRILGISEATVYPDIDGLARDLKSVF